MSLHDPYDIDDLDYEEEEEEEDEEDDGEEEEDYSDDFPINDYGYDEEDEEDVRIAEQTTAAIHLHRQQQQQQQVRMGNHRQQHQPLQAAMSNLSMHQKQQHHQQHHRTAAPPTQPSPAPALATSGEGQQQEGHVEGAGSGEPSKPRILLMGLRRSGKSSIQKVVFQKMSPHETLFLESTNKIVKNDISNNSFVQFQIWDFPGQIDFFDSTFESSLIFGGCGALLFVIDAQDEYIEAVNKLNQTIQQALRVNRNIVFEVFIHKVDGISEDHKIDTQREIQQHVADSLMDHDLHNVPIRYHLTSIYDHSIFEAFSKVIQKLIPQLPTLENLLDMLVSNSRLEKAFLFDVVSKIYIATDSNPVDNVTYELCSDMIDVVIDVSCIYGPAATSNHEVTTYDDRTSSVIKLNNNMVLYLREVNKYLALVSVLHVSNFDKIGLVDYNFTMFKKAIEEVFQVAASFEASRKKREGAK